MLKPQPTDRKPLKHCLRRHGLSYTPEYRAWQQMRLRCTDPNHAAWPAYGGRGITVCARWVDSPEAFVADMGAKPSAAHELDRINNDGGYSPDNCRWVLRSANCRNRRNNVVVEHAGESMTLVEWAERAGLRQDTLRHRMNSGWPFALAISTPARAKAPAGQAKPTRPNACVSCRAPTGGTRCRGCENRHRAIVAANYSERQALKEAA